MCVCVCVCVYVCTYIYRGKSRGDWGTCYIKQCTTYIM